MGASHQFSEQFSLFLSRTGCEVPSVPVNYTSQGGRNTSTVLDIEIDHIIFSLKKVMDHRSSFDKESC